MANVISNPVAERHFKVAENPDRIIVVSIGIPTPDPDPAGDWRCAFHVEGIESGGPFDAHGVDALQAMLLAIEASRTVLDASGLTLSWMGGESNNTGIPHMIPLSLPAATRRSIERYIVCRVNVFARWARVRSLIRDGRQFLTARISGRHRSAFDCRAG
jgi:hypothetical protein